MYRQLPAWPFLPAQVRSCAATSRRAADGVSVLSRHMRPHGCSSRSESTSRDSDSRLEASAQPISPSVHWRISSGSTTTFTRAGSSSRLSTQTHSIQGEPSPGVHRSRRAKIEKRTTRYSRWQSFKQSMGGSLGRAARDAPEAVGREQALHVGSLSRRTRPLSMRCVPGWCPGFCWDTGEQSNLPTCEGAVDAIHVGECGAVER